MYLYYVYQRKGVIFNQQDELKKKYNMNTKGIKDKDESDDAPAILKALFSILTYVGVHFFNNKNLMGKNK